MKLSSQDKRHSLLSYYRHSKVFRKADILVIAVLLTVAVISVVFSYASSPNGEKAEVYIDGDLVGTYSLNQDKTIHYDIGIDLHIDSGKVAVVQSDCPDKICTHIGYINKTGQRIICAPNKFVVVIRGGDSDYDAITGRRPI